MSLILGLDTGGTYTDGAIIDSKSRNVLCKAKSLTTKECLSVGIASCIDKLDAGYLTEISFACLSTTLATNAIVEGKGSPVGLILINTDRKARDYSATKTCQISGSMHINGDVIQELSEEETAEALLSMKGSVKALAVSGFASVRNPKHELAVKSMAIKMLGIPVVCGHELTSNLGYDERTITAVLNAKLISEIQMLVAETKKTLEKKNVNAQILIVKGDGHLMTTSFAEEKPINTIMSGPAASVIGTTFLTNEKNAVVVDIGGTTTDIADIEDGQVFLKEDGAIVGGRHTRVRALEMHTHGLGGDSCLFPDSEELIKFGPQRAEPICVAASSNPHLIQELYQYRHEARHLPTNTLDTDCVRLLNQAGGEYLNRQDQRILNLLSDGAHSIFYLAEKIGRKAKYLNLNNLQRMGLIQRISLTPTDLLHASGEYKEWNVKASQAAVFVMAEKMSMTPEAFIKTAKEKFINQLAYAIGKSLLYYASEGKISEAQDLLLLRKAIDDRNDERIKIEITSQRPIIGLGAPAEAWLPDVCKKLHAELILPPDRDVANAIGAAAGNMRETVEAVIKYDPFTKKFRVHGFWGKSEFVRLDDARSFAEERARNQCMLIAEKEQIDQVEIIITEDTKYLDSGIKTEWGIVEIVMRAIVSGKPGILQNA